MANNDNDRPTRGAEEVDIMSILLQLPEDLREDILCRLPATTLRGMRRLCSTFHAWIDNPGFAAKHFSIHKAISCEEGTPLISIDGTPSGYNTFKGELSVLSDDGETLTQTAMANVPVAGFNLKVAGTADGLVVLQKMECPAHSTNPWGATQLILWNPLLGKTLIIPRSPKQIELGALPDPHIFPQLLLWQQCALHALVGFVYDAKSKDYKVVVVVSDHDVKEVSQEEYNLDPESVFCRQVWVEVYSVRTSSWLTYKFPNCLDTAFLGNKVCIQGVIHWIDGYYCIQNMECRRDYYSHMMSVHLDTHMFYCRLVPQNDADEKLVKFPVLYNGSLALFIVAESYTKLYVLKDLDWVAEWSQNTEYISEGRGGLFAILEAGRISNAIFFPENKCLLISQCGLGLLSYNFLNNSLQLLKNKPTSVDIFKGSLQWNNLFLNPDAGDEEI